MHLRLTAFPVGAAALLFAAQVVAQDSSRPASSAPGAGSGAAATRPATRSGAARGPLPDPALLDGSTLPVEKRPEHGMLGEFEIPGDENAKDGKVGGQQQPPGQKGGGGKQDPGGVSVALPLPGIPGLNSGGAGGQQGLPGLNLPNPNQQQGGAGSGGPPSADLPNPNATNAGGGPGGGPNDPNAKAEGVQVGSLGKDAAQAGGPDVANVPKPTPVKIGDPTMQIKTVGNAAGVVGAVTAGATQQMEKGTGGGKGGGSPGDNGNRGVEKGRTMPAGL